MRILYHNTYYRVNNELLLPIFGDCLTVGMKVILHCKIFHNGI